MAQMIDTSSQEFLVLGQLIAAFGDGAGEMVVSQEVLGQIAEEYVPKITEHKAAWTTLALTMLSLSRLVGAQAAHRARTDGSGLIELAHYSAALAWFGDPGRVGTYFCCPFTYNCFQERAE